MSTHFNLSTGKFLNSSTLFKLGDALLLDVKSGEIVMSNMLVPRASGVVSNLASLNLNFASSKSLTDSVSGNNLITFSRASTGTYVDSAGLIQTSPVNLLTYSEDTTNSVWVHSRSTQTIGGVAPDGSNTANDVTVTGSGFNGSVYQNQTLDGTHTFSVYVKKKGFSVFRFGFTVNSTDDVYWNIDTDTFSNQGSNVISASSTDFGNGWYRISVVFDITASATYDFQVFTVDNAGNTYTTVNGTDGFYMWGAQLEEGSTATTYIPTTSTISGAPRFDHDPVTLQSLGLLIEESRANFMLQSTVPASTSNGYNVDGASVTINAGTAPDGTNTASLISAAAGTGSNRVYNFVGGILRDEAYSYFIKASSADAVFRVLVVGQVAPAGDITYTFSTGAVGGSFSNDVSVEPYPNGWFRLSFTAYVGNTLLSSAYLQMQGFTGDFFVWGVQREAGVFPTSYIPTTGSTVTRAADVASITGTNFSSWFNTSEGTLVADLKAPPKYTASKTFFHAYGASLSNNRMMSYLNNSSRPSTLWENNNVSQAVLQSSTPTDGLANVQYKQVLAYATDDFVVGYDGGNLIYDTSGTPDPTLYRASIGSYGGGAQTWWNGHIAQLSYYPTRLTDEELVTLTQPTPSLDLNFATSLSLTDSISGNDLITFSRASSGTYVDSAGLIKNSAVNLATYSEDLTQKSLLDATAPTATLLQCTAQAGAQTPYAALNTYTFPKASTEYTVYADFEKVSIRYAIINFQLFSVNGLCVYDLDTGLVSNQPAGFTCGMTEVETGVYRCSATHTTGADTAGRISFGMSELSTIHRITDPTTADQITIHRIQIEEGSTATDYIPTTNTIGGAPRFDHDPDTLSSLGLLVEESRVNLALYSEELSSRAQWTSSPTGSETADAATAPDGNLTADYIYGDDPAGGAATKYRTYTLTASTSYTFSVHAKPVDTDWIFIRSFSFDAAANAYVWFNVSTGVVGRTTGTPDSTSITPLSNGWYRCSMTITTGSDRSGGFQIGVTEDDNGISYAAGVTVGAYLWGVQLEAGSFPTSYIPTTTAAVTRAADVTSITGTNFSSWYNQTAGTLFIDSPDFPNYGRLANSAFVYISDQSVFNLSTYDGIKFGTSSPPTNSRGFITEAAVTQADFIVGSGSSTKFALAATANDATLVADGTAVGTDNTVVMPTGMNRLGITPYGPGLAHLSQLSYYPVRLPDARLQTLTS